MTKTSKSSKPVRVLITDVERFEYSLCRPFSNFLLLNFAAEACLRTEVGCSPSYERYCFGCLRRKYRVYGCKLPQLPFTANWKPEPDHEHVFPYDGALELLPGLFFRILRYLLCRHQGAFWVTFDLRSSALSPARGERVGRGRTREAGDQGKDKRTLWQSLCRPHSQYSVTKFHSRCGL